MQKKRKGCSSSFALGRKKAGAFDFADEIRTPVRSQLPCNGPTVAGCVTQRGELNRMLDYCSLVFGRRAVKKTSVSASPRTAHRGRNVRWPRRCCPRLSHYAYLRDGTDTRRERQTPDRRFTPRIHAQSAR